MVKLLIAEKVNLSCQTINGYKAIHFACSYGYLDIIKLLVQMGVEIHPLNNHNKRPIDYAIQQYALRKVNNSFYKFKFIIEFINNC